MSARRMMPRSYSGDGRSSSSYNGDDVNGSSLSRPPAPSAASRSYLSSVRPENRSTLCSVMAQLTEETQPSFEITLKSRAVSESCNVKFTCMVTGHPTPRVLWYRDDVQLDRYCGLPKYEIFHDGPNHSLHIFNCSVDDAAIYQASASNSKGIVSCSGVLEVGVMSEFLIHQRYFSKLKQKAENKRRDLDSRSVDLNQQEQLRTISPDRSQRKRRSPMEVTQSPPSSTENEEAEEGIQFPLSQAEVRLQDAGNVEAEEKPIHATNGTASPITNGQAANENGSKAVTYVYDSMQKTFTSHQPKAPFIKKKIKISNSADGMKPDAPVEMVSAERLATEQASEMSSLKESRPLEEVMEVESTVVSSASTSEKQHQRTAAAAQSPTSEPSEKQKSRFHGNIEAPSLKKQVSASGPPAPVSPAVASPTCHISSETDSTQTAKPEKGVGNAESLSPPIVSTQKALHPVPSPKTSSKDTVKEVITVTRQKDITVMDVDEKPLVIERKDHTTEVVNMRVDTATPHAQRPPEMSVNGTKVHRNLKSAAASSASALDKETKQHPRTGAEKKVRPHLNANSDKLKASVPGTESHPSQKKHIAVPGPPASVSPAVASPTRQILSGTESKPAAKPKNGVGHVESLSPPIVSTQQPSHPITFPVTSSKDTSKELVAVTQQASHPVASPEISIKDTTEEVVAATRQEDVTVMEVDEKPLVTVYQNHTAQAVNVRCVEDAATAHRQGPPETSVNGASVELHRSLNSAGGGDAVLSRPPCEPRDVCRDQLSGRESSSGQRNVCVSGPSSPLGKAHTQTSRNDAPVNIEPQPARRETATQPRLRLQREPTPDVHQTPALHNPVLAASDAMSQGTWAHSRGSNESRTVPFTEIQKSPLESPAEGEKTPGCNVSPTVPQCHVEKAIKAVEPTEIQVDEKLVEGNNKLTLQVHGDTLVPTEKKAEMETDLPLNTSEHAKTEGTIGEMGKEDSDITMADVSESEMDENELVLKSPNLNPEKPSIQKTKLLEQQDKFKEIPTPAAEVISIAELLRAQMTALGSSVSSTSPISAEDEQCPTTPQVQITTKRRQELEKLKPDRVMKMSIDISPASNIKSEHLQAHHRIVQAECEPMQSPNVPSPNTQDLKIPPIAVTDADSTLKNAIILTGSTAKENDSVMDTDQDSVLIPLKDNPDICLLGAENVQINVTRSAPKQHTADSVSLTSSPLVIIAPENRIPPENVEIERSSVHSPRVISVLQHDTETNCHSKDTELQNQNAAQNTDIINEGHSTSTTKSDLGTETHVLHFPPIKHDISRSMAQDLSKTDLSSLLSVAETNISRRSNSPVFMTPEHRRPLADVVTEIDSVHYSSDGQKLFHCQDLVFSQNINPETQVISETHTTLLGQHKEHKPSLQTIQLLATESVSKDELQGVNVQRIQQDSYVSEADKSSEIASLSPDNEDGLRKENGTPPIPSATPQELASGARRKIFTPKLQTEDSETVSLSDNQSQKDEASTKNNKLSPGPENTPVSPSLSRRSPLLQPGSQQTPPTERRSPLLQPGSQQTPPTERRSPLLQPGSQRTPPTERRSPLPSRRKMTVDVAEPQPSQETSQQISLVQNEEKPAGKDKQDPFKAPQVIRKIRGEPFSDASGHLKLWCQFFNVLADSTIRWFRDEVEFAQLERSAGDETPVNLAIVQASSRDCGVYGCSITNQHGTDSTDFLLSVDILAGMFLREELGVGEEIEMTPLVLNKGVADAGIWANKLFGRIMMQESHIGEGCSHKAWRAKVIYGLEPVFESGTTCIIKVRNAITYGGKDEKQLLEKNLEVVQQECRIQNMAREYCKIFSAEARVIEHFGPTLEVIPVYVMYRPANTVPHGTVETDLNGLYTQYCVVDTTGRLVMRTGGSEAEQKCCTLQHWIHQWTNGNLLFIRLEGVDTRITNVAISIKSPGYQCLPVAANPRVFEQFTSQHQCNYYCGLLGLRSLKAMESLQTPTRAKGTSRSPLLQRKLAAGSSSPQSGRKNAGSPRLPRKSESDQEKTAAKQ